MKLVRRLFLAALLALALAGTTAFPPGPTKTAASDYPPGPYKTAGIIVHDSAPLSDAMAGIIVQDSSETGA
jgi:hypothetical protein